MAPLPFSPATTVLLLTAGIALIYIELNRPGRVLPGCAGLLGVLLGLASATRLTHPALALTAFLLALLISFLDTRRPNIVAAILIVLAFGTSFATISDGALLATHFLAGFCAALLGIATHILARIAAQARSNKTSRSASKRLD